MKVGKVTHYYGKIGVAIIEVTGKLKVGDHIQIKKDDEVVVDQELKYQRLYILDLQTEETVRVSPDNIHVSEFDWSPDGSQFAIQVSNTPHVDDVYWHSRLAVMERSGGEPRTLVEGTLGNVVWSPDGKTIAFFHPSENLTTNIPAVISPSVTELTPQS